MNSIIPFASFDTDLNRELSVKRENQQIADATSNLSGISKAYYSAMHTLSYCLPTSVQVGTFYDVIVSHWGIVTEVLRKPGIYWLSTAGLETKEVWIGYWNKTIDNIPVNDKNAFPMSVSIICTYQVVDSIAATFLTSDCSKFIDTHVKTALQKVFATKSYNNKDEFNSSVSKLAQAYVDQIGIKIKKFSVTRIAVQEAMQKLLLAKQEAQAYITGRKAISEGAVKTIESTLKSLKENKIELTDAHKNSLVVDFIYMMCQEGSITLSFIEGQPTPEKLIGLNVISLEEYATYK